MPDHLTSSPFGIPLEPADIARVAAARGLVIPPACQAGVAANLALLAQHAAQVMTPPSPDTVRCET